jgi:hypothetical protein
MFKNWKTTSAGIVAIISSIVGMIFAIKNKQVTPEVITGCVTGFLAGIGLLFAKDNDVTP